MKLVGNVCLMTAEYDDGLIVCSGEGLMIRRYDAFLRPKRIRYAEIRTAMQVGLDSVRFSRWRIWGSTDLRHWFNLDRHRPTKRVGFVLDLGKAMNPVITPDDPERLAAVLHEHGVQVKEKLSTAGRSGSAGRHSSDRMPA
jgi:hypothetical protein